MIRRAAYQKVAIVHLPASAILSVDPALSAASPAIHSRQRRPLSYLTEGVDFTLHDVPVHLFKQSQRGVLIKDLERHAQGPLELVMTNKDGQVLFYRPPLSPPVSGPSSMPSAFPPASTVAATSAVVHHDSSSPSLVHGDTPQGQLGNNANNNYNNSTVHPMQSDVPTLQLQWQCPLISAVHPDARFLLVPEKPKQQRQHNQQHAYPSMSTASNTGHTLDDSSSAMARRGEHSVTGYDNGWWSTSSSDSENEDAHESRRYSWSSDASTIVLDGEQRVGEYNDDGIENDIWIVVRAGHTVPLHVYHSINRGHHPLPAPGNRGDTAMQQQQQRQLIEEETGEGETYRSGHAASFEASERAHEQFTTTTTTSDRQLSPHSNSQSTTITPMSHSSLAPPIPPRPRSMTTPYYMSVISSNVPHSSLSVPCSPPPPYTRPLSDHSHHPSVIPNMHTASEQQRSLLHAATQNHHHYHRHHQQQQQSVFNLQQPRSIDMENAIPSTSRNATQSQGARASMEGEEDRRHQSHHFHSSRRRGHSESHTVDASTASSTAVADDSLVGGSLLAGIHKHCVHQPSQMDTIRELSATRGVAPSMSEVDPAVRIIRINEPNCDPNLQISQQQHLQHQTIRNIKMEDTSQARDELVSLARAVIDTLSSAKATHTSTVVSLASSPQEHRSEQQQEHWGQLPAGTKQQEDTYTINQEALARLQGLVSKATAVIDKYDSQHHHHHRRISLSSVSSHEHTIALTTTTTTTPAAPASLMLSPEATPVTSPVLTAYPLTQSSPPTQPQPRKTSKKMPGNFLKRTRSRGATQPLLSSSSSLSVDHTSVPENNTAQLPLSPPSSPPMNSTSTTSTWTPLPAAAMAAPAKSATADKGSSANPVKKNRRKSLLSGISPSSLFQRLTNNSNRHSWAAPATMTNEHDATHNPRDYLDDDSENGGFDDEDSSSSSDDDDEEEEEDDDDSGESEEEDSDSDDEYVSSLPSQAAIVCQQYQQRVEQQQHQQQQQQRSAERQRDQYPRRRSDAVVSFAADVEHHDAPPPSYETATTAAMTPTRYLRSYSYSSSPAAALPLRRRLPLLIQLLIQFESYILDSFKTAEFLGPCNSSNGVNEMTGARISALSNSSSSSSNSSSSLASLSSAFKRSKSFSKPKPKKTVTISTTTNRDLWLKRQPETISSFANWLIDLEQTGLLPQAMSTSWRARSNRRSNSISSNSNDSQRATTSPPASPTTMTHDNTMMTNSRITASPPMSPTRPATAFSLGGLQYETQESWLQRTCMSLSEIDLAYAMLALEQHCVYGVDAARWSRSSSSHRGDITPRVVWRQTLQSLIPIA